MKHLAFCCAFAVFAITATSQAAIYTVTNSSTWASDGSLGWAVQSANDNPGPDSIHFAIGTGPVTLYMANDLYLLDPVTIDGTTQPGYDGKPVISIQRPSAPAGDQLITGSMAAGSIIRGLAFNGDNSQYILGVIADNVSIENCWFGVTRDLENLGSAPVAILGGGLVPANNLRIKNCVFGNVRTAIKLDDAHDTEILDNAIGTDPSGTAQFPIGDIGILVRNSTGTFIGASGAGDGNIITNCAGAGIGLIDSNDTINMNNRIFNNVGIAVDSGLDNYINYNDFLDSNISLGGLQNYPSLQQVRRENGTIQVEGFLSSTPNTEFVIEVFASETCGLDATGESQYQVGYITTTTDGTGEATFSDVILDTLPANATLYYSAAATRADSSWGTSEISKVIIPALGVVFDGKDLDTDPGWIPSGIDSGPEYELDPSSPDDVDLVRESGILGVQVHPSPTRNRVAGWRNPSLMRLPSVQNPSMFVRGKFYIYASNPMDAPLNTVPNFRIRLEDEGAVLASNTYQYSNTGRTAPAYEPFYGMLNSPEVENRAGASLRPSSNPLKPSLYRVDFAPPYNPASAGTSIGATFEAMAMEDPADGLLALTEVQLATYDAGSFIAQMSYFNNPDIELATGLSTSSPLNLSPGMFNVEADFQAGRRQQLDLEGEVPASELATVVETANGTILDTGQVSSDHGGIAVFSAALADNEHAPRIEPGKRYLGLFIVSSDMPAVASTPGEKVQGGFSFQLQTAGGALTTRLEYVGPASLGGPEGSPGRQLLEAGLPGRDSQNWYLSTYPFPEGDNGGVYVCLLSSPLSPDIHPEAGGDMGPLADEPGPGVNLPSFRDISIGVNALQQPTSLRITPDLVVPWAEPNRARIRISAMIIGAATDIYDGGYGY